MRYILSPSKKFSGIVRNHDENILLRHLRKKKMGIKLIYLIFLGGSWFLFTNIKERIIVIDGLFQTIS